MHCTECGAEMSANSKFCGSCGQQVRTGGRSSSITARQKGCLVLLAIVIGVWFIGRTSPDTAGQSAIGTGMQVSVEDIAQGWRDNEIAAEQTYGKSDLEVTGTVTGVSTNLTDQAVIRLRTSVEDDDLRAFLAKDAREQAGSIAPGQTVTLHCGPAKALLSKPFVSECRLR
jgi:hypothetical protein